MSIAENAFFHYDFPALKLAMGRGLDRFLESNPHPATKVDVLIEFDQQIASVISHSCSALEKELTEAAKLHFTFRGVQDPEIAIVLLDSGMDLPELFNVSVLDGSRISHKSADSSSL
jgi:hypothetical protein